MNTAEAFKEVMSKTGIEPPAEIIADGDLHRFHVFGDKPRTENGWYVFHNGNLAAGAFGCWKRGVSETWSSKEYRSLTTEEKARYTTHMDRIRRQREEEQARGSAECRKVSKEIWDKGHDVQANHPYIVAKGIKPTGIKQLNDTLLIPVRDYAGTLHGLQFINPDRSKRFKIGTVKAGNFFWISGDNTGPVLICEGYATGASLNEATGYSVAVAFDAGNLDAVTRKLRVKMPDRTLLVCADNDQWTEGNPGITKATAAARESRTLLAIPKFRETETNPTDFNDLHQLEGLQAVNRFMDAAIEPLPETPEEKNLKQNNNLIPLNNERIYFIDEAGNTCRLKKTHDGFIPIILCNFAAWITREISEDNGIEITHYFAIAGKIKDKLLPEIETTIKQFSSLNWLHGWGNEAIIEPGQNTKDYIRHAIQTESKSVKHITCFTHTGFREINGSPVYLTSGGGIGAENITVKLSREMQKYCLPLNPENEIEAIKASLSFLDVAKRAITIPLFALLYISPLTTLLEPMPNFSGYLFGETGSGKSTLATLLLCHFGDFLSLSCLPNFEDTANNLEKRAFTLKDTFMILDDYHPTIKRTDTEKMESTAQRIIRSYSNRTGRGRLNYDSTDKGRYEPRGMLLVTGEELVRLQSTIARLMILELCKGDIFFDRLTTLQQQAGLLPNAITSYVSWVIENMSDIKSTFKDQFPKLRQKIHGNIHAKLPEQCAFLQFSINTVLSWMIDKNILTDSEASALSAEAWDIFINLSHVQSRRIQSEDPIKNFVDIFTVMIEQGKIKIEDKCGTSSSKIIGGIEGDLIGWHDELYFYLIPKALWHALQGYCLREGTHYPVSERTFSYMLQKQGFIAEAGKESASKPVKISGDLKRVIKIYRSKLLNEEKEQACHEALSSV